MCSAALREMDSYMPIDGSLEAAERIASALRGHDPGTAAAAILELEQVVLWQLNSAGEVSAMMSLLNHCSPLPILLPLGGGGGGGRKRRLKKAVSYNLKGDVGPGVQNTYERLWPWGTLHGGQGVCSPQYSLANRIEA